MSLRLALLAAVAVLASVRAEEPKTEKIRVLIVDGQNNHDWRQTTPHMKKWLEACGRFAVDVATSPPAFSLKPPARPKPDADEKSQSSYKADLMAFDIARDEHLKAMAAFSPDFAKYNAVLSNYNGEPWPKATNKALESLLSEGKIGLVIVHAANNSFAGNWQEYDRMIGLGWRGNNYGARLTLDAGGKETRVPKGQGPGASHGAQHPFLIVVRDGSHPITKGMPAEWLHAQDELYHGLRGPAQNMHLLATAYSSKKFGGTGEHEPMIWTVSYGKGRVFHTPMGHALEAMRCVGFITTLQRGTEWAATGDVTIPLPENFPTEGKTRSVPAK
jgi:type 1 glutamine amidotransferase